MSIDSLNTSINPGSFTGYKPNNNESLPEIKNPELQDVAVLGIKQGESIEIQEPQMPNSGEEFDLEELHEQVQDAVKKLNETAKLYNQSLKFKIHEATHRTMISVIDSKTDKVIREIPGEKVLDMVAKMRDYIGGIFDAKA